MATAQFVEQVAAEGAEQIQIAAEDTREILTQLVVPIYVAGLILPIPIGWLGDIIAWILGPGQIPFWPLKINWAGFPKLAEFFTYLGHVPAGLAFILVGYYYWQIVVRGLAAETAIHALPNWLQKIVAKWSISTPGQETVIHRNFRIMATIGLWGPVALWVPIELPVWRHLYHYTAAIAAMMAVTVYVASSPKFATYWRRFYGHNLGWIIGRHVLGLMGFELVAVWGYITSVSVNFDLSDDTAIFRIAVLVVMVIIMASIAATMVKEIFSKSTPSHKQGG